MILTKNKGIINFYIWIFFIFLICLPVLFSVDDVSRLDYDAEILQNFNNKSEVRVIIVLKDTSHIDVDGTIENKIKKLKEKNVWFSSKSDQILSNFVQDEFRPVGKLSTGFSGFITRKGFDKLIKNPMVESIHISLPVYATNN